MKTKSFFLVCLFLGLGMTRLSAQMPPVIPDDTRAIVWSFYYPLISVDVFCNGVSQKLTGYAVLKETDLFKNGVITRGEAQFRGELTSESNETFSFKVGSRGWGPLDKDNVYTYGSYHQNITGDQGTHYIARFSYGPDYFTIDKAICLESKK